jgi:predicted dienelactone hydrolase
MARLSTQMGFATLAQTLARHGYLVASVEHVGDTWQDQSMRATPARYFAERPRQVSRVIDTVLADPLWSSRIGQGADGRPLIGAIGHSAGGYTVLALAGGKPVLSRLRAHCETEAALDPVLCNLSHAIGSASVPAGGAADGQEEPVQADPRVRAVMALAPMGVAFSRPRWHRSPCRWPFTPAKKTPSSCRASTRNGSCRTCAAPTHDAAARARMPDITRS